MRSKVTPWPHTEAAAVTKKKARKTMPHRIYPNGGLAQCIPAHSRGPLQETHQLPAMLPDKLAKLLRSNRFRVQAEICLQTPAKIGAIPRTQAMASRRTP